MGEWLETFYLRPTLEIARALLGALLIRDLPEGCAIGRIVETEAYLHDDPACHAVREFPDGSTQHRQTKRNQSMFGPPGHAYVYFTYGNHFLLNLVTQPEGVPEAVLIRALEPLTGVDDMLRRRGVADPRQVTNGPGKLTKALGIDRTLDGHALSLPPLRLEPGDPVTAEDIVTAPRIGITRAVEHPWRFYLRGNPWVSKPRHG